MVSSAAERRCTEQARESVDDAIEKLLQNSRVWRGRSSAANWQGLASGYACLDQPLPGGGWPPHALTEILLARYGSGELKLLMPALARLSQAGRDASDGSAGENNTAAAAGWIAWIAPPFQPYPPALLQWGVDLSRVLVVRPKSAGEALWAAEQALSSGNCAAVLLWSDALNDVSSRRLQLAAESGKSWAIAFRPLDASLQSSAAALRVRLVSSAGGTALDILKSRGGRPTTLHNVIRDDAHERVSTGINDNGTKDRTVDCSNDSADHCSPHHHAGD